MPSPQATNPNLDAALAYARFGWHVFPCRRDKKPMTAHGWQDATTDEDAILTWWRDSPMAAIGVATGPSGLVAVDYDPGHDPGLTGIKTLDELMNGTITRQQRTGSGGQHFLFLAREGVSIRNSAGKIGPGVDVRAEGGYIIVPPSENEAGAYRWLNYAKLAPLPEAIISVLAGEEPQGPERASKPLAAPASRSGTIPAGQRNQRLASLAGTLRKRAMSPLAIEQALRAENRDHCSPPLSEAEVLTIARSISRYAPVEVIGEVSSEPVAELLADDQVSVAVTLRDSIRASFLFTEMDKDRRELHAHLQIQLLGAKEPYQQRINLESSTQRTELRRELDNLYGKDHGWAAALNGVWSLARETYLGQDRSTALADIPLLIGARDLIQPLMPAEGTTVFFGDGSTSKSYLGLSLAVASVTSTAMAGVYRVPQSAVLYVDYEDSDTNFRRRAGRVLSGLNLPVDAAPGLHYWKARGVPLRDQCDAIRRACERHGIGWLIVDSAAPACGGPPEEAQSALAFFTAVARIGLPTLLIAHITKADTDQARQKPFGTAFWHNMARRTWYVHRIQEEESDTIQVALYCKKVNDGPKPRPIGFEISFNGEEGPVQIQHYDLNANPELAQHTSPANRVWSVLDRPLSIPEIAEATGMGEAMVRKTLNVTKGRFVPLGQVNPEGGGRPLKLWGRAADEELPF